MSDGDASRETFHPAAAGAVGAGVGAGAVGAGAGAAAAGPAAYKPPFYLRRWFLITNGVLGALGLAILSTLR